MSLARNLVALGAFVSVFALVACGAPQSQSGAMSQLANSRESGATGTAKDLGGPITLEGKIAFDRFFKHTLPTDTNTWDGNYRADIRLTLQLSEKVRAVLRTKLAENHTTGLMTPEKLEGWLKEAFVEIRDVGGQPVAFIVGKHPIAFGAKNPTMPVPENDPAFKVQRVEEVMGVTVALGKTGFFDLIELSAFENQPGDLSVGDVDGAAIRFTKNVTDKIVTRVSAMHASNGSGVDENRAGIGLLYTSGKWTMWADGAYLEGSVLYPNSHWYGVAGARYGTAQKAITVQATVIENVLSEIGLGAQLEVLKNTYLMPEIRYRDRDGVGGEVVGMMRLEYRFTLK